MQRALPDYDRHDIAVYALSYDSVKVLGDFAAKHGITYTLFADEGSQAIRRLGLYNDRVQEQHAANGVPWRDSVLGVPYPGVMLLDEQGVVIERRFEQSYRVRETGAAVLERGFGVRAQTSGPSAVASGAGIAVRAYLDSPTYRLSQRLWLTVEAQIDDGLHLYGSPIPAGYIPFSVTVAPIDGLEVGPLTGPTPSPFRVDGLDEAFVVYDGEPTFALPLTFWQKPGDLELAVEVSYQACSATDCLMPATLRLRLPLTAQNHVDSTR